MNNRYTSMFADYRDSVESAVLSDTIITTDIVNVTKSSDSNSSATSDLTETSDSFADSPKTSDSEFSDECEFTAVPQTHPFAQLLPNSFGTDDLQVYKAMLDSYRAELDEFGNPLLNLANLDHMNCAASLSLRESEYFDSVIDVHNGLQDLLVKMCDIAIKSLNMAIKTPKVFRISRSDFDFSSVRVFARQLCKIKDTMLFTINNVNRVYNAVIEYVRQNDVPLTADQRQAMRNIHYNWELFLSNYLPLAPMPEDKAYYEKYKRHRQLNFDEIFGKSRIVQTGGADIGGGTLDTTHDQTVDIMRKIKSYVDERLPQVRALSSIDPTARQRLSDTQLDKHTVRLNTIEPLSADTDVVDDVRDAGIPEVTKDTSYPMSYSKFNDARLLRDLDSMHNYKVETSDTDRELLVQYEAYRDNNYADLRFKIVDEPYTDAKAGNQIIINQIKAKQDDLRDATMPINDNTKIEGEIAELYDRLKPINEIMKLSTADQIILDRYVRSLDEIYNADSVTPIDPTDLGVDKSIVKQYGGNGITDTLDAMLRNLEDFGNYDNLIKKMYDPIDRAELHKHDVAMMIDVRDNLNALQQMTREHIGLALSILNSPNFPVLRYLRMEKVSESKRLIERALQGGAPLRMSLIKTLKLIERLEQEGASFVIELSLEPDYDRSYVPLLLLYYFMISLGA